MPIAVANDIEIYYETLGDAADPPIVMVMGLTAQIVSWDRRFFERLADAGRHLVIFDNRDVGYSTHFHGVESNLDAILAAALAGDPKVVAPAPPYRIDDMARDVLGLMDAVGLDRAAVFGASMGGMIAQAVAILAPERVSALVSMMSTTSEPAVSRPEPEALGVLLGPPSTTLEEMIAGAITSGRITGSKRYFSEDAVSNRARREHERGTDADGGARQLAAVLGSGHRADELRQLDVPTLVIHGTDDTLLPPIGGQRTAELIPGAQLLMVDHMGHDVPEELWDDLIAAVVDFTG